MRQWSDKIVHTRNTVLRLNTRRSSGTVSMLRKKENFKVKRIRSGFRMQIQFERDSLNQTFNQPMICNSEKYLRMHSLWISIDSNIYRYFKCEFCISILTRQQNRDRNIHLTFIASELTQFIMIYLIYRNIFLNLDNEIWNLSFLSGFCRRESGSKCAVCESDFGLTSIH